MKKSILFLAASVALAASRAFAHPEGHETQPPPPPPPSEHGHEHHTAVPATVEEIWKEIDRQQAGLEKTVTGKNLGDAHDHAFAIRDLTQSLATKASPMKRPDAEEAARKIADLATAIDKSAAAGAQKTTEASVKTMIGTIKTLRLIVPHAHGGAGRM